VEPFFWPRDDWIPQPRDWKPTIVRGKTYDLTSGIGREIWAQVVERLEHHGSLTVDADAPVGAETPVPEIPGGFGDPVVRPRRVGQGTFRVVVTDVYRRRCAVTGEKALPVLDAAHIRSFSQEREHYVSNGILLRSDVHRLFDSGYMTVTQQYRAEVSDRIHEDFDDGENYRKMHGSRIHVPDREDLRPDPEFLRWHNENRYRG